MRSTAAGIPFALALLSSSAAAQGPVPGFEAPPIAIPGGPGVFTGGDLNGDSFEDLVVAMTGSSGAVALLGSAGGLGAPSPVVSGTAVFRVLLADANHDGKLDLFFVTPSATRIALGVGNGTFGSPASVATTSLIPAALAAGDLDLDGDLDVVLADGPGFSFVLGDGSGGFGPKTTVAGPVGALPRNLALADLDHDGDLDVVTTVTQSSTTDRLAIYLGDGSGGFAAPSVASIPGLSNVPTLALGDLNGDGTLDSLRAVNQLAVMLPILPGRVEMRLGDGAGGFGAIAYAGSLTNGAALEARDVTNDGLVDVAYVDGPSFGPGPASCSWLIADGAGGLGPETRVQPSVKPSALLLDDLTHDGRIDLVTTDSNASTLHVLAGDGAGHFGPPTFAIGVQPRGLVTSDFDRDGRPDVAVASRATTSVSVLLGTGSGFLPKTDFAAGAGPESIAHADLNGDGLDDLVVADQDGDVLTRLLGTGTGAFGSSATFPTNDSPASVGLGDLDHDGAVDAVVTQWTLDGTNPMSIFRGDGSGGFGPRVDLGTGVLFRASDVEIADLTGDGHPDVLVANESGYFATLFPGDGAGGLGASTNFELANPGFGPPAVEIADLQDDGIPDFVVAGFNGILRPFRGAGGGAFGAQPQIATGVFDSRLEIADLNGDGIDDLALAASSNGPGFFVLRGLGNGEFAPPIAYGGYAAEAVASADLDGDGRLDLLVTTTGFSGAPPLVVSYRNETPVPAGLSEAGTGTPGCLGTQGISGTSAPTIGNASFAIVTTQAPKSSLGLLLIADAADPVGHDVFGIGVIEHLDFFASVLLLGFDSLGDPTGHGSSPVPIPNAPSFAGATVHAQTTWLWSECDPSLFGLSSSRLLSITLQP